MFTIAFRNGISNGQAPEGATVYNEEYLQDSYKNMNKFHIERGVINGPDTR